MKGLEKIFLLAVGAVAAQMLCYASPKTHTGSQSQSCLLKRHLDKSGFHRELVTRLQLPPSIHGTNCSVLLIEEIPAGAYVDLDQVASMEEFGGPKVYSGDSIDIEAPAQTSNSHELYVYSSIDLNTPAGDKDVDDSANLQDVLILLPVHLRYHPPREDGTFDSVSLQPPKVLAHCQGSSAVFRPLDGSDVLSPCSSENFTQLCEWKELQCQVENGGVVSAQVPVGNLGDVSVVVTATVLVSLLSAALLSTVIIRTQSNPPTEKVVPETIIKLEDSKKTAASDRLNISADNTDYNAADHDMGDSPPVARRTRSRGKVKVT